jgi:hypothetical protein
MKKGHARTENEIKRMLYERPGIISIDGRFIGHDSRIVSKSRDILLEDYGLSCWLDVAVIRELGRHRAGEIDLIKAVSLPGSEYAKKETAKLLKKLVPYCMRHTDSFIEQLERKMEFDSKHFYYVWLDIVLASPGHAGIEFGRAPNYTRKFIPLKGYH